MRVVFDLDGTLADCTHRLHFIDPQFATLPEVPFEKDWDAFYDACGFDKPIKPMLSLLSRFLDKSDEVEIWTGRKDRVRGKTARWFTQHFSGGYNRLQALRMRPDNDHSEDDKLKERWLDAAEAADQKPDLVFEDRQKVVDMWRRRGVMCCQVARGNF